MDPVRFGRALGIGARLAAKTTVAAVDAAFAPNPNAAPVPTSSNNPANSSTPPTATFSPANNHGPRPAALATRTHPQPRQHLVQNLFSPIRRLSGVLWLELTGVFFGLFALTAITGAWRLRSAWHATPANSTEHTHLLLILSTVVLFTYFCVSSFLRARRRGRQP